MLKRAYAEGDTDRANRRYSRDDIEWCDEFPPEDGKYDLIVLDHFLQTGSVKDARRAIEFYVTKLSPDGRTIVIVPSLEWCVTEIATKTAFPVSVYLGIYGTVDDPFKSGFTLHGLRTIIEHIPGIDLVSAENEAYVMTVNNETEIVRQNVITVIRNDAVLVGATE